MIVFDLEWTQPFGRALEEVIQIGAVKIDTLGGAITDSFSTYIKPTIYRKLSPIAKRLPDADLSLESETLFLEAYHAFAEWCADDTVFASWGGQDLGVLAKNAQHWNLPAFTAAKDYNLQAAFSRTLDTDRQLALETAVAYCRLPTAFSFHNALNDAMYTALVTGWIALNDLPTPPKKKKPTKKKTPRMNRLPFSTLDYPAQPRCKTEVFPSQKKVLNCGRARFVHCPICKERLCVARWYPLNKRVFFGTVVCPEHGRFPVRLTVTQRADGQWRGCRTIPILTDTQYELFFRAKANEPIPCKAKRKHPLRRKKLEQSV